MKARDKFSSAWRAAQRSFVSATRSRQAEIANPAEFGAVQLRGHGSTKNYDYVANRYKDYKGTYLVGRGDKRHTIPQGGSWQMTGLEPWLRRVDSEVRARIVATLDAKCATWFYRQIFQEKRTISVTQKRGVWTMPDGSEGYGPGATKSVQRTTEKKTYTGWPCWSGYSRSQMGIEWQATGTDISVRLASRAPYTKIAPACRATWRVVTRDFAALVQTVSAAIAADLRRIDGRRT